MSKDKLVPELRFPEFKNEGEWIVNELNDFCFNISSGKDKNSDVGKYELYGSTGIIGRTDIASYNGDYILVARVGANAGLLNRAKGKFGVTDNTLVLDLKKLI
jgi:type I restriction enzyme S subunit